MLGKSQDSENIYLYLEAVQGLPVHKLLQMAGPLNESMANLICIQVALIMRDFHKAGYIYRDIKASNFMMNSNGQVKMIDLGHSKKINRERTFTICGTRHAMPPDIYENKGYSYEFDYYSYGILIYELLTGKSPFGYQTSNPTVKEDSLKGLTPGSMLLVKN